MKRLTMVFAFSLTLFLAAPITAFAATTTKTPTATESVKVSPSESPTVTPTPMTQSKVDYTLPYPGMLSDSPLYFLKRFRDWVMNLLIADPVKKIDFYVLQSDKQINAATFLIAKARGDLATQAISEASVDMNSAMQMITTLKSQGKEVPGYIVERLQKSLAKHEEVLSDLVSTAAASEKEAFTTALTEVRKLKEDAAEIK